jgi:hypothetical protein
MAKKQILYSRKNEKMVLKRHIIGGHQPINIRVMSHMGRKRREMLKKQIKLMYTTKKIIKYYW